MIRFSPFFALLILASLFVAACGDDEAETPPNTPPGITRTRKAVLAVVHPLETNHFATVTWDQVCVMLVDLSDGRRVVEFSNAACPKTGVATDVKFTLNVDTDGRRLLDRRSGTPVTSNPIGEINPVTERISHLCDAPYHFCTLSMSSAGFIDITP